MDTKDFFGEYIANIIWAVSCETVPSNMYKNA